MTLDLNQLAIALDRERGKRSLANFVRGAWSQIEPNALVWNWHMDAVCLALEAVTHGIIRDLIIAIPPGMSKSLLASSFWPAWDWIDEPTRRFICSTYGQELSEKNAELHRNLVQSDWYQERWPEVQIGKDCAKKVRNFHNTQKGWRFSTSVGGPATGRHGDILLFDDLVKAQDSEGRALIDPIAIEKANEFWFKTMHTRRADPQTTARVGIMQRLHHEDTAGKCIDAGYTALVLPMEYDPGRHCRIDLPDGSTIQDIRTEKGELLNPGRFPRDVVEEDREALGPITFESQMQQNPTPREGAIFRLGDFKRWAELPAGLRLIITVDCAFKDKKSSDFVAIQCWGVKNPNYYLIDQIYGRFGVFDTMEQIAEMKDRHPRVTGIYVEDKANGPAVIQILTDTIPGLNEWSPGSASKVSRAEAVEPLTRAGNVYLPQDREAPWIGEYLTELTRFPLVKHDDRVDATTMALLILHKPKHRRYRDAVRKMRGRG